jgi:tRNA threonylcarbamoyl adenosine modification protein YeaZ
LENITARGSQNRIMNQEAGIKDKKVVLFIDTSSNEKISVGLKFDSKKEILERDVDKRKAQAVLPMVDELLKKHSLSLSDLTMIEVVEGPGSFTGLRVGAAIANALAFALKIPVNGKKIGNFAKPRYE